MKGANFQERVFGGVAVEIKMFGYESTTSTSMIHVAVGGDIMIQNRIVVSESSQRHSACRAECWISIFFLRMDYSVPND